MNQFKKTRITKEDRERIIEIFLEDDLRVYNDFGESEADYGVDYFIVKLDDDCDDVFYDHSTPFAKIFEELSCIPTGFQYSNEFYEKGDINTYYGIWFDKLEVSKVEAIING